MLAGTGYKGDFAVTRLNTDGALDTSFGGDGAIAADFPGATGGATGVALQADGKIVAAGSRVLTTVGWSDMAVARIQPGGGLDSTFSAGPR